MATGNRAAHLVDMIVYGDPIDPNKNANEKEFGKRLKAWRERVGLTQEQLAAKSGLSADTCRRAEKGTFSPSLRTLTRLASGLGIPVHVLLRDGGGEADDLAECIRALPEHDFRIVIAIVRVLSRLAAGQPSGV